MFWKIREARQSGAGWHQGFGLGMDGLMGVVKTRGMWWVDVARANGA
jgi:hypothetical protein